MMTHPILSLHHVTATVDDAQADLDFCLGGMSLRLVKKTVNFDNHHVYHFYYGDERGTPEYNLALGERRAVTARAFLMSLGISGDRLRTVSYGKEFPFDPGHDEAAYSKNRRAHFVITAK